MSPTQPKASTQTNPHCNRHSVFAAGCDQCCRARAAFQPYHPIAKVGPATRSFQNASSLVITESSLSGSDIAKVVAADVVAESLVDVVLELFRI